MFIIIMNLLPYAIKRSRGKRLWFCMILHSIMSLFLRIMTLSISNISLQACYCESFPVNKLAIDVGLLHCKFVPY